ncbi:MAG: endonuclease/exonuclease/phosphatase family protein [Lachnospiraceae bacterium]|nr:endonuclease/exonuclease/phosphatase family protein [Lachnospiraceae bacterium]
MKHKAIKITAIAAAAVVVTVIGYLAYLMLSYSRIEDNQTIDITQSGEKVKESVSTETEYSIMTYNIGFGAYSDDYSFFMDGGKHSRAFSKESVLENTNGSISIIQNKNPDFVFLQEVDLDSTRSYHVNQYDMILDSFDSYSTAFGINFDSAYLFYPFTEPHGKSLSGMATISNIQIAYSIRRSLPISENLHKFLDLDRCYTISKVPVANGKYLCLYNVHLSAYTDDISIVEQQIKMLAKDLQADLEAGNYIVCGGDFNQDLLGNSPEVFGTDESNENWASPFPVEFLPEGFDLAVRRLSGKEQSALAPSCRNADKPYVKGENFITMVDGFILSSNVEMTEYQVVDTGFAYSDHNPVYMKFRLREQ